MTRPSNRGGPRPGSGRKPYADPTTAREAADALSAYCGGAWPSAPGVWLDLPAAVALLHKLRRRTGKSVSRRVLSETSTTGEKP